jgi:ligand-binding sensor domain-containing protein
VYHSGETTDGRVWLGTSHGLRVPGGSGIGGFSKTMIPAVAQDDAGNIWIGTGGEGLYLRRAGSDTLTRIEDGLPDNTIATVLEDREQNLWIGTADGLVRLSAPEIENAQPAEWLSDVDVTTVYCDPRGGLWLATAAGGAFRYLGDRTERLRLPAVAAGR